MFNHAPSDYKCPICIGINGGESHETLIRKSDIVYRDAAITAFVSSFFIGKNKGHIVIVPNNHVENLYDIPDSTLAQIHEFSKKIARVLKKAYRAEGITLLQNNEPIGNQHAFHYHLHVFPRYANDNLHDAMMQKMDTTPEERLPYAEMVRNGLNDLL
jgi:histidine triad (HIT) family protein